MSFWEHAFWWFDTEYEVNVENKSSKYWSKMNFIKCSDKSCLMEIQRKVAPGIQGSSGTHS